MSPISRSSPVLEDNFLYDNADSEEMSPNEDGGSPMDESDGQPNNPSKLNPSSKRKSVTSVDAGAPPKKPTKRRAAHACTACRTRKVRCDVVEGSPCGNCRWEGVECVVQESRRRKKSLFNPNPTGPHQKAEAQALKARIPPTPVPIASAPCPNPSVPCLQPLQPLQPLQQSGAGAYTSSQTMSADDVVVPDLGTFQPQFDNPNAIYRLPDSPNLANVSGQPPLFSSVTWPRDFPISDGLPSQSIGSYPLSGSGAPQVPAPVQRHLSNGSNKFRQTATASNPSSTSNSTTSPGHGRSNGRGTSLPSLPAYFNSLPRSLAPEDADYLQAKGALVVPDFEFQSALLRAYVEYVHPYMPLLDLPDFLRTISSENGEKKTSLFLYQAVMFAATAFVGSDVLKRQGFTSRRAARQAFFSKARLLYDFDCEGDRLVLVQGLLLMTYWYETPDDQKDTWHWMGVAISLAHTIGLHRSPVDNANITPKRRGLSKRLWWCCFMRDRLVALGMRRPTRIADDEFDVPMLEEQDFDIEALPEEVMALSPRCTVLRNIQVQQEMASMCIQKAKLCVCLSKVLKTQYSVLKRGDVQPDDTTSSNMMLFPKAQVNNTALLKLCDLELVKWFQSLPQCCQYRQPTPHEMAKGLQCLAVQRSLLHMVYHATVSALHRPRFVPSESSQLRAADHDQALSRMRVRSAAHHTTVLVQELRKLHLEKYLPTTGVTVLLPTIIMHLLDMGSREPHAKARATQGINICMQVLIRLREVYAAANFAVSFLVKVMGSVMSQSKPRKMPLGHNFFAPDSTAMNPSYFDATPTGLSAGDSHTPDTSGMVMNEVTPPPEPMDSSSYPDLFANFMDTDAMCDAPPAPPQQEFPGPTTSTATQTSSLGLGLDHHQSHGHDVSPADVNMTHHEHSPPTTDNGLPDHEEGEDDDGQRHHVEGMMGAQLDDDMLKGVDNFLGWAEFGNEYFDFDAFQSGIGDGSMAMAT